MTRHFRLSVLLKPDTSTSLWAEGAERADPDPVPTSVGEFAHCREKRRCLRRLDVNLASQRVEIRDAGFHKPFPS